MKMDEEHLFWGTAPGVLFVASSENKFIATVVPTQFWNGVRSYFDYYII